jgi:transcriptional regulator with XRE-family HTH domain
MSHGKRIGLKERESVFELASQGLSLRQIADRLGISSSTVHRILVMGLKRCGRCGRVVESGELCPACSLPPQASFGERLKAFRMATGISQLDLALKIGVEPNQERSWEYGQKQPSEHELRMIVAALGITVRELTGKEES